MALRHCKRGIHSYLMRLIVTLVQAVASLAVAKARSKLYTLLLFLSIWGRGHEWTTCIAIYTDETSCHWLLASQTFHDYYGIDEIKLRPHGCHFTVNDAPPIHTPYIVVCQNEVRQLQAQALKSLVETGVIIHEPSKCSHPALKLNGEVKGVNIHWGEHPLLSTVEVQPSHCPGKLQRVL